MSEMDHFSFDVITGDSIKKIIDGNRPGISDTVEAAYLLHDDGETVNPDSYFLRFDERPNDRIIALPAYIKGYFNVSGIKWISSFPGNIKHQMPRASAALLLNRMDTGYPFACLEASLISAARTAASAVLGAYHLNGKSNHTPSIGFVGTGIIGRNILEFFKANGWTFDNISLYDQVPEYAKAFAGYASELCSTDVKICDSLESLVKDNSLIVLTTTAPEPYITDVEWLGHNPIILNISLRDLSPEIIVHSNNILDDVGHCLKANTSPHLAEIKYGNREFINGTLAELIRNTCSLESGKPSIFSPFGLGVLDLAVGKYMYDKVKESNESVSVPDFFAETKRWGTTTKANSKVA